MNHEPIELKITHLTDKGFARAEHEGVVYECIGALPGEEVKVVPFKRRRGVWRSNIVSILKPSLARIPAEEPWYSSSSPLQIATYDFEKEWKKGWIEEQFRKQDTTPPRLSFNDLPKLYHYRNKVEFAFYSDETGLHLAVHTRGTAKGKMIATGSKLAPEKVGQVARKILDFLQKHQWEARMLKGLLVRYSFTTDTCVAAIFTKEQGDKHTTRQLQQLIGQDLVGLLWVYSDPRAPDNRITEIEHELGSTDLAETILDKDYTYPWDGFFQVNPPVFALTLNDIRNCITSLPQYSEMKVLDLYAGVGTIGIGIAYLVKSVQGVELHGKSQQYALANAAKNTLNNFAFLQLSTDNLTKELLGDYDLVIVDPPRSGLMPKTLALLKQLTPRYLIYLSCNPATQASNLQQLSDYQLVDYTAYNYYPRTMHVEGLAVLQRLT